MLFGFKPIPSSNVTSVKIDNVCIAKVEHTKFLGVIIDQKFTWSKHISLISSKLAKSLYVLSRLGTKLSLNTLITIYNSLIYPHLNYCNILWGCASKSVLNSLTLLQKRAIRVICHVGYRHHTDQLFSNTRLLKFSDINIYQTSLFMYKFYHNMLPDSCKSFAIINDTNLKKYNFRKNSDFSIPKYRTSLREKFIKIHGPRIWNSLPQDLTSSSSISIFKTKLKQFLLSTYC